MSDFITNAYNSAKDTVNEASLTIQTADQRNASQTIKERVEDKIQALKDANSLIPDNLLATFSEIQENHDKILARAKDGASGTSAREDCAEILTKQEKLEEKFNSQFASFTQNPEIEMENDKLKAEREYRDAEGTIQEQAQDKLDQAEDKYNEVSQAVNEYKNRP